MADMPDGTLYGTIIGGLAAFIGDTDSDTNDLPDKVPLEGTVVFEPSVTYVIYEGPDPEQDELIYTTPDPVKVGSDGRLHVKLVATDSPVLNPTGWYYTVKIQVPGRTALTARIEVRGGETISLARAIGAAQQPGVSTAVIQGGKGDPGKPGKDGHTPVLTWDGDALVIDGAPGPHLKGDPGRPGDPGKPGPANSLSIGNVKKSADAGATITGDAPSQVLNLELPKGDPGGPGPANTLAIGTVTAIPAGGQPTASITGTAPSQVLNLGLVSGGSQDTGWRDVREAWLKSPSWLSEAAFRRIGNVVYGHIQIANGQSIPTTYATLSSGFQPRFVHLFPFMNAGGEDCGVGGVVPGQLFLQEVGQTHNRNGMRCAITYVTDDPWPTTYPGTPA